MTDIARPHSARVSTDHATENINDSAYLLIARSVTLLGCTVETARAFMA
jgi:hypothetical protein